MSRRIAFCILAATSALMTPAAQAAQNFVGARIIHANSQPTAPSLQSGLRHSSAERVPGTAHHGRRIAPLLGWGGGYAAAAAFVDAPYAFGAGPYPYPYPRPDPDWRICQIGPATELYYECGPFSYHPFGAYGYRPNGVYGGGSASAAPDHVRVPSAKIITIDEGK
jgi:hypothetical protein